MKNNNNILSCEGKISEAIQLLQTSDVKIIIVVSKSNKILGTITDGDIRRGLINGKGLENNCTEVMNKKPKYALKGDEKDINLLLQTNKYVPLVNDQLEVIETVSTERKDIKKKIDNIAVIMAGGEGKRLTPLTLSTPKPMLPINKKPLIQKIIDNLSESGLTKVFISIFYKGDQLINYFNEEKQAEINIEFLKEKKPLGTAGSLSLLNEEFIKEPVIVLNGDVLTNISYGRLIEFHKKSQNKITICAATYDIQIPFGAMKIEGYTLVNIQEKPIKKFLVNAGIYVVDPKIIHDMEKNKKIDMTDLVQKYIKTKSVGIFPLHEHWLDIGNHKNYEEAQDK